jgi:hypothetical protein
MSNQHICEDESRPREDGIPSGRDGRLMVENQSGKAITAVVVTLQKHRAFAGPERFDDQYRSSSLLEVSSNRYTVRQVG